MAMEAQPESELVRQAAEGDHEALGKLLSEHHGRLEKMIDLRMDHRLRGRLDAADILQETFREAQHRIGEYPPSAPSFFLWLRGLAQQKLVDACRFHLGAEKRSVCREVRLLRGATAQVSSESLAAQLLGRLTSASQAAQRTEIKLQVQTALDAMDTLDREVLALRHFEQFSNAEVAQWLGITPNAASNRYVRALQRMRKILESA